MIRNRNVGILSLVLTVVMAVNSTTSLHALAIQSSLEAKTEVPVVSETPETEVPVASETPETEVPVASETPEAETEVPVTSETPEAETEVPVASETPEAETEVPVASETPETETEVPVASETTEAKQEEPDSELPRPETTVVRGRKVFRYEVSGINEVAEPFVQRAMFPEDGMEVMVTADLGVFPAGATAKIKKVTDEKQILKLQENMREKLPVTEIIFQTVFYDIVIIDRDGNEIQPDKTKGEVKVVFNKINLPRVISEGEDGSEAITVLTEPEELETERKIIVFDKANNVEVLEADETETGLEASAPHFSVYAVATTRGFTNVIQVTPDVSYINGRDGYIYEFAKSMTLRRATGSPIDIRSGTVVFHIPAGVTVTSIATSAGSPGIWLPSGAQLIVVGGGKLIAQGGNATSGANGEMGGSARPDPSNPGIPLRWSGEGGGGGSGGTGSGAGIGGGGGNGGNGAARTNVGWMDRGDKIGGLRTPNNEKPGNGSNGSNGGEMGTLYVLNTATVDGRAGTYGPSGGFGGAENDATQLIEIWVGPWKARFGATSGGGGGGGWGSGIGGGGSGGGGGGSGGTGHITGNRWDANWWGANGGGGGGSYMNHGGGNGGKASGENRTETHLVIQGNWGDNGNGRFGGAGGASITRELIWSWSDGGWKTERVSSWKGGNGGNAGVPGGDGRVYKATGATVIGRSDVLTGNDHSAVKYNLTGIASPTAGGTITGSGNYMFGDTKYLTAQPKEPYWKFKSWDDGDTWSQIGVMMNRFGDITRTGTFERKALTINEMYNGTELGEEAYAIVNKNDRINLDFRVKADGGIVENRPSSELRVLAPDGSDYSSKFDQINWRDVIKMTTPRGQDNPSGLYTFRIDGQEVSGGIRLVNYELKPVTAGGTVAFTLKASPSATELASDSIIVNVDRGGDRRPFAIDTISVGAGEVPIEIVPKAEVEANKNTWTSEQANSRIALEINGIEYTKGMVLKDGDNTFTIYNANTTTALPERSLSFKFPKESSGVNRIETIPLYTEETRARLRLNSYVGDIEKNPITGAKQKMEEPILGGATGDLQPLWHNYNLTASEPEPGYHFSGWYDGNYGSGNTTPISRERNFTYRIPAGSSEKNLEARYFPKYDIENGSFEGQYFIGTESVTHTYDVYGDDWVYPPEDYSGDLSAFLLVRKKDAEEEVVSHGYEALSWNGRKLTVQLNKNLMRGGIYYPRLGDLTQGQPYPDSGGARYLIVSKLNLSAPLGGEKTALTMKASSAVDTVASDGIELRLNTPYEDVTSLQVKSVKLGTSTNPLVSVARGIVETNKTEWGWKEAQLKVALEMNGVPLREGMKLDVRGDNTLTLYNANAIRDEFNTEVRLEVELTRKGGEKLTTTLVIPINVQPTQIRAAVPLSVTLAINPAGKIISPTNFAIQNKTAIPLTVEALKVTKDASSGIDFTDVRPSITQRNQFYGIVNVEKSSGGAERYVLAEMTDNVDQPVSWEMAPGTADTPTTLPINFKGSEMSLMIGGRWPEIAMKVFSLSYTLASMKE